MCGIFGFASKKLSNPAEFWNFADNLFIATQSRGRDASGFAAMADGAFVTEKAPFDAMEFVGRSVAWRNLRNARKITLVGHTRAATHGSPDKNTNNHPFHGPRFSIVHNGGIFRHEEIAKRNKFKLATECDSELILHFMERETNAVDGSKAALENLDRIAMMAVASLDRTDGSVYLFRTNDAPCVVLFVKRWNAYIFASTPAIINETLHRLPATDKVIETIINPFDNQQMPAYHSIQLTTDGRMTDRPLDCNFVSYASTQSQARTVLGGYASTFAGQLADTTQGINCCVMCGDPISSKSKTAVRLGAGEYGCGPCVLKHFNSETKNPVTVEEVKEPTDEEQQDVVVQSEANPERLNPTQQGATIVLDAEHILQTIAPSTTGTRDLTARDGRAALSNIIQSFRTPPEDYDLTEYDVMQFISLNAKSIDDKMNYWAGMGWSRLGKMADGEYLAYSRFIEELV